jgi:hypothetical protein
MRGGSFMTDSIDSLLVDYDLDYDDFNDNMFDEDALRGVTLDEHFRAFSFHRVNGGNPFEYGGNAAEESYGPSSWY